MRTQHLQPISRRSASSHDKARHWRYFFLAATLALFTLMSSEAGAEPIPSGRQRLTASDAAPGKTFGDSVAVDGDTAVIGAPLDDTQAENSGAVYVFIRVNNAWVPHPTTPKLLGSASAAGDQFGSAVAISGQSIVVAAVARNFSAGAAYVFRRASAATNSNWTEEQNITPGQGGLPGTLSPQDQFGSAVSISGSTVLVGAQGDTSNEGAVYAYLRGSTTPVWTQQAKLLPLTRVANAAFGVSLAILTDTAIIGAPGQTDEGSAFVFRRVGTTWSSGQALTVSAPLTALANGDSFGSSVAVSGNWVLVGASGVDKGGLEETGAVFFFERSGGAFVSRQRFDTPTPKQFGEFGHTVVMAGNRALVSAPQELNDQGQVHLLSLSPSGVWSLAATRLSSGLDEIAGFGRTLALSADAALVGASQEPCTEAACVAQGSVYAYGIIELAATVPLMPPLPLLALGAGLGLCGIVLVRRRAQRGSAQI